MARELITSYWSINAFRGLNSPSALAGLTVHGDLALPESAVPEERVERRFFFGLSYFFF